MSQVNPTDSHWYRPIQGLHLALVISVAFLLRMLVFYDVAINGDTGLYIYDAKQLLWGRQIFVDFPSRSPLFEGLLAIAIAVGDSPIVTVRLVMVGISLVVAIAIYLFAREIRGHRAGILSAAVFALTPFSIVWGTWVKTEQAAALVVLAAFVLALRRIDADRMGVAIPVVIGLLFAIAWQIRRVAIVHIGAFCLFVLWYRYTQHNDLRGTIRAAVIVVVTGLSATLLAYAAIAGLRPGLTIDTAMTHGAALFLSDGQGSLGWIGLENAEAVTAATGGGLLASICQKCGANTIETVFRVILVTLPVMMVLLVYLRSYLAVDFPFWAEKAVPGVLLTLSAYAFVKALQIADYKRSLAAAAIFVSVAGIWLAPRVEWSELWSPKLALPVIVCLGLAAGYLYRDRILYPTYFQDLYPFVAVIVGVTLAELVSTMEDCHPDTAKAQKITILVLLLAGVLTMGVAVNNAYPYQPGGVPANASWHSVDSVQETGDHIDRNVAANQTVFAAQPLYVVESDRRLTANLSRKIYAFKGWPNASHTANATGELHAALESGTVPYAVIDSESHVILDNSTLRNTFQDNYCKVDDGRYGRTNGQLYEYRAETECENYEHPETHD